MNRRLLPVLARNVAPREASHLEWQSIIGKHYYTNCFAFEVYR
jgi:hypothetical protein